MPIREHPVWPLGWWRYHLRAQACSLIINPKALGLDSVPGYRLSLGRPQFSGAYTLWCWRGESNSGPVQSHHCFYHQLACDQAKRGRDSNMQKIEINRQITWCIAWVTVLISEQVSRPQPQSKWTKFSVRTILTWSILGHPDRSTSFESHPSKGRTRSVTIIRHFGSVPHCQNWQYRHCMNFNLSCSLCIKNYHLLSMVTGIESK